MIQTKGQYRVSKQWLKSFKKRKIELNQLITTPDKRKQMMYDTELKAITSQIITLEQQIEMYKHHRKQSIIQRLKSLFIK